MTLFTEFGTTWNDESQCDITVFYGKGVPIMVFLMEYKSGEWWTKVVHSDSDPKKGELNLSSDRSRVLEAILRSINKRKRSE